MTFKYNNVYLTDVSTVAGPYESHGPLGRYYDKIYNDFYCGAKTWEQAECRMLIDSVDMVLYKANKSNSFY